MVVLDIMAHLGLLLGDVGYGVQTTAWIITVQTAVAIVFQFLGGRIGDRIPKNVALFIFTAIQGLSVVFLTWGARRIYFYAFVVLFGIGFGDHNMAFLLVAGLKLLGAVLFLIARKPKLPGLAAAEAAARSGQRKRRTLDPACACEPS